MKAAVRIQKLGNGRGKFKMLAKKLSQSLQVIWLKPNIGVGKKDECSFRFSNSLIVGNRPTHILFILNML